MSNTKKKLSVAKQKEQTKLKRYPKHVILSYARLMARDPETIERLMTLDGGAYIVTKP